MRTILFIMIGLSSFSLAKEVSHFRKVNDIVIDSKTGLEWQDNNSTMNGPWNHAINYCEVLILDTHDDWRLPNINELKSIVDRNKGKPALVSEFEYIAYEYDGRYSYYSYWSSTNLGFEGFRMYADGGVALVDKYGHYNFRCLRDGQ